MRVQAGECGCLTTQSSRREKFELIWVDEHGQRGRRRRRWRFTFRPERAAWCACHGPRGRGCTGFCGCAATSTDIDNTIYFADERREEKTVVYIGADRADDPAGLLYYLERVFVDTPRRAIKIVAQPPMQTRPARARSSVPLVIVTTETGGANARRLEEYVRGGGTLLYVVTAPGRARDTCHDCGRRSLGHCGIELSRVMLGEIKFDHPLFAPFAGAQFNDFTKIHFWKHRLFTPESLGDAKVLARFETGDAAVIEKTDGKGRLVVFASGWQQGG